MKTSAELFEEAKQVSDSLVAAFPGLASQMSVVSDIYSRAGYSLCLEDQQKALAALRAKNG